MAAKAKTKAKSIAKAVKKVGMKAASPGNSSVSRVKAAKAGALRKSKNGSSHSRPAYAPASGTAPRVEARDLSKGREIQPKVVPAQKPKTKQYSSAIHAYESGLKLMHAEEYDRAIKAFRELIAEHSDEPEIQERARVLMHASEKKVQEKAKTVLKSADDHYNMAIAELNRRELDAAEQHLQHALKLAPKGDHILYAMAAVNALKGNREDALSFLKQSIHSRPENRFMAARDSDFENLKEDTDFKHLVTTTER